MVGNKDDGETERSGYTSIKRIDNQYASEAWELSHQATAVSISQCLKLSVVLNVTTIQTTHPHLPFYI